jgi:hypothetical protein
VLRSLLPPKEEIAIYVRLSDFQVPGKQLETVLLGSVFICLLLFSVDGLISTR